MNREILLITMIHISISAHEESKLYFSSNEELLSKCIEDNLLKSDSLYEEVGVAKYIADKITKRFSGKSVMKKNLNNRIHDFFWRLKRNYFQEFSLEFRIAVKKSLEECAGDLNLTASLDFEDKTTGNAEVRGTNIVNEWITFNRDKTLFTQCIEDYFLNTDHRYEENKVATKIARMLGSRFSKKFTSKNHFYQNINKYYKKIILDKITSQFISQLSKEDLKSTSKNALEYCFVDTGIITDVPTFESESSEIADVLDYVLVSWPFEFKNMIRTHSGRALLRSYATKAQMALERALYIYDDNGGFRVSLREAWLERARNFYDGNDIYQPYIPYLYTLNHPKPHMEEDLGIYLTRLAMNFSNRNPSLPRWYLYNILNIHSSDRPGSGKFDIFAEYQKTGISSAEYYLENQLNQFYRILFFIRELNIRGIFTDRDDNYNGNLPYDLLPENIQNIYNDETYREYLFYQRRNETSNNDTQNVLRQNLANTASVREEDLIMLWVNISSIDNEQFSSTAFSSTIFISSTTFRTTSTSHYQLLKRKESSSIKQKRKNFTKKARTEFTDSSRNNNNQTDEFIKSMNKVTDLSFQKIFNRIVIDLVDEAIDSCSALHVLQLQLHIKPDSYNYGYIVLDAI